MLRQGFGIGLVLLSAGAAFGQAATTVQLPEFRFFTVQTTVSVPDSGRGFLGGVNRAGAARTTRGAPFFGHVAGPLGRSTSIGSEASGSSVSVHATIIDHAEWDRAVLAEAAARRRNLGGPLSLTPAVARQADFVARNVGRGADIPLAEEPVVDEPQRASVEELRRRNAAAEQRRDAEAAAYLGKANRLVAEGKGNVAKIYFKMAAARADEDLKAEILELLADLEDGSASRRIAASRD